MSLLTSIVPSFARTAPAASRDSDHGVKPVYSLDEKADGYELAVYLPGVDKAGLELTAEAGTITIVGRRAWKQPTSWTGLYRESTDAPYELVLTHDNVVDLDKIQAELRDGVLRIALPKAATVKPRTIEIK